jgi:hypothetical protein
MQEIIDLLSLHARWAILVLVLIGIAVGIRRWTEWQFRIACCLPWIILGIGLLVTLFEDGPIFLLFIVAIHMTLIMSGAFLVIGVTRALLVAWRGGVARGVALSTCVGVLPGVIIMIILGVHWHLMQRG